MKLWIGIGKSKKVKSESRLGRFASKYRHIGVSFPGVPVGWLPIVERAIVRIEQEMWPRWTPIQFRWLVHWLAMGNSIVKIKYWWGYRLRQYLTKGQMITCIKEKFAGLRIYGSYNDAIERIIKRAEFECHHTCQFCGSGNSRIIKNKGWLYNACSECEMKLSE